MSLSEAIHADREGRVEDAASLYESALASAEPNLTVFLNLSLLYWQSTDVGFATERRLSPEFVERAGKRFPELLHEMKRVFPSSTEARFWDRYIGWTDLGASRMTDEECIALLKEDASVLVPAMELFIRTAGREYRREAMELLRACRADGTAGARYVVSVLEGALKRERATRWKGPR